MISHDPIVRLDPFAVKTAPTLLQLPNSNLCTSSIFAILLTLMTACCGGSDTPNPADPPIDENVAPNASFTNNCANLDCTFDSSASADSDGTISSYSWDFGDNTSSTNALPSHIFASAGSYTVSLTVTDNEGTINSVSLEVVVTASSDSDGTITNYDWDFGDSNSSINVTTTLHRRHLLGY